MSETADTATSAAAPARQRCNAAWPEPITSQQPILVWPTCDREEGHGGNCATVGPDGEWMAWWPVRITYTPPASPVPTPETPPR